MAAGVQVRFVRNPWDHAVSDYLWRRGEQRNVSFKDFLRRLSDPSIPDPENVLPPIRSNWRVYTIDDEIAADFVGRFERIELDLAEVSRRLGFTIDIGRIRAKSESGGPRDLRSFYDEENVQLVADVYSREIEAF